MHSSNNLLLRCQCSSTVFWVGQNTVATVWATFLLIWRRQASLIEEAQDGVLHHNTWCSETSCGGISPYTLMGRYGPHHQRWLGPQDEDVRRTTGRRAPQGYKILYQIGYFACNSVPSGYIRRGRGPLEDKPYTIDHILSTQINTTRRRT